MDAKDLWAYLLGAVGAAGIILTIVDRVKGGASSNARWQGGVDEKLAQISNMVADQKSVVTVLPERMNRMEYELNGLKEKVEKHICDHQPK